MKEKIIKYVILWYTGGIAYFYLEILFRGYSHFSMIICGGLCFLLVGLIGDKILRKNIPNIAKILIVMLVGSFVISLAELITGLIVNVGMGLDVWDYSDIPYNFMGQICLTFSFFWSGISLVCVYMSYMIRCFVFEDRRIVANKKEEI